MNKLPSTILGRLRRSTWRQIALRYDDPEFERLKADAERLVKAGRVTIDKKGIFGNAFLTITEVGCGR